MCTVTYLPLGNNEFILTSNRDESPMRKTIPPKIYLKDNVELTYPKDELAGGTWVGTSSRNRLVCLLNGGFKNHIRNSNYKMSRGVVVKNILSADIAVTYINEFDFTGIEPFTLILVDWNSDLETYELVWDGTQKHFVKLPQEPKIWSSSTLYTEETKEMRKEWFTAWLSENKKFNQKEIIGFHKNEKLGTSETSPKMKRAFVETVSITSLIKKEKSISMNYVDLQSNSVSKRVQKIKGKQN